MPLSRWRHGFEPRWDYGSCNRRRVAPANGGHRRVRPQMPGQVPGSVGTSILGEPPTGTPGNVT
jgi:hypothetical protein